MKPVVAYRHKLRWKLWRLWQEIRVKAVAPLGLVLLFVAAVISAAAVIGARVGLDSLQPTWREQRVGSVVAIGPMRPSTEAQPIALVRIGADVVRFEQPLMADCQIGDQVEVQQTYRRSRGYDHLINTEPLGPCRPLP